MMQQYDLNTEKLMTSAYYFNAEMKYDYNLMETVCLLRESFKNEKFKKYFFTEYNPEMHRFPSAGFCFYSSYFIMKHTKQKDFWEIKRLKDRNHWFLAEKSTGRILDITFDQFKEVPFYESCFQETLHEKEEDWAKKFNTKAYLLGKNAGLLR